MIIVQFTLHSGRFRTAIQEGAKVRKHPEREDRGPFLSDVHLRNWLTSEQCWVCNDLACPSLRGMSEMFYALPCRLQSVSERILSRPGREGSIAGMDVVLFLRHAGLSQPLAVG